MKKTFLFCTKPLFYLSELPPVVLLILCIFQNNHADGVLKLYPLIVVLSLFIIFVFVYFFRGILISNEEIRSVGLFSSRDNAIIDKGKTLTAIIRRDRYVKIELSEKTANSSFSWDKEKQLPLIDVNLYRDKAIGGKRAADKILKYFGVSREDRALLLGNDEFEKTYENFNLTGRTVDKNRRISIEFTETI